MKIKILINEENVYYAVLNETETAKAVYEALPITANGETWGEEIYFSSGINAPLIDPKEVLEEGELAYWPPMKAICIFYGPTPASHGNEIRAAGPVSVFGKIEDGDIDSLKKLDGSVKVAIEKA